MTDSYAFPRALTYDDAIRGCAVSTVTADRTGKFVLLTYSLTASHCSAEAHLAGVPSPHSFDSRLVLRQSCSACLKSLPLIWMQKNTPVTRLNKGFSCQEKGDKNCKTVLSRVAKLRSVVALLHG